MSLAWSCTFLPLFARPRFLNIQEESQEHAVGSVCIDEQTTNLHLLYPTTASTTNNTSNQQLNCRCIPIFFKLMENLMGKADPVRAFVCVCVCVCYLLVCCLSLSHTVY